MNILLTNDDGYQAAGINILAESLASRHNVFIVAPSENRSASSNIISISRDLEIRRIGDTVWSCSGFPADCVLVAVKSDLLPVRPDCILSGINEGANMGTDILYSGTCAAARQGTLEGIASVALSLVDPSEKYEHYKTLADFAAQNLETLISLACTERPVSFVNVNALSLPAYKGAAIAQSLCARDYGDKMKLTQTDGGYTSSFIAGKPTTEKAEASDYHICMDGYVSISCVASEPLPALSGGKKNYNFSI